MLPDSLLRQFHTPPLRALFAPGAGPGNEGYDARIRRHAEAFAPAVMVLIYHALADVLEKSPDAQWVKPVWRPILSNGDLAFLVDFWLELSSVNPKTGARGTYGNGRYPDYWSDSQRAAYNDALETGEQVGLDMWNHIRFDPIVQGTRYESVAQIEQEMEHEYGELLARVRQWELDNRLPEARATTTTPRM
jgi:hypothetical protein